MRKRLGLELMLSGALALAGIAGGCVPSRIPQAQTQVREIQRLPLETRLLELMEAEYDFDLAEAAFIALGVRDEAELKDYLTKFEKIVDDIKSDKDVKQASNKREKIRCIYERLSHYPLEDISHQREISKRYKTDEVKLTEVVDNQLKKTVPVGNCIGLTVLTNAVCQRLGINLKSVRTYLAEERLGEGAHIYSITKDNGDVIKIENTLPGKDGFDYKGYKEVDEKYWLGNKQLIIAYLKNIATTCYLPKQKEKAVQYFVAAARIDPDEADFYFLTDTVRKVYGEDKLKEIIEDLHQRFPDSPRVKQYLSYALEKTNPKRALELYKQIYPGWRYRDAFDIYKMGEMHAAAEEYAEALPFLEEAMDMDPNNSRFIGKWYEVKRKVDKDFDRKRQEEFNKRLEEARKK